MPEEEYRRRQNVGTPHVPLRSYRGQSRGISCLRRGPSQADRCGQPHEPAAHHGTFPPLPFTQTTSDDEGDSYSPMENIDAKVGAAHTTYVGVGHGLQLHYGPHAGRLVVSPPLSHAAVHRPPQQLRIRSRLVHRRRGRLLVCQRDAAAADGRGATGGGGKRRRDGEHAERPSECTFRRRGTS